MHETTDLGHIDSLEKEMVGFLVSICSVPAISPASGGKGELEKAKRIESHLAEMGFADIARVDIPDDKAEGGVRPNIVVTIPGETPRKIWLVCHMDIVPPGDLSEWKHPPFSPVVKDGKVIGRGTEDNGQELTAAVFAAKALLDLHVKPKRTVKLCLVSDEETGSEKGIQALIDMKLFDADDIIVVPDYGVSDSSLVEVGEKSILWFKVAVEGRQAHASTPQRGINAHRLGADILRTLDKGLHEKFSRKDALFEPPTCTFEPTRKVGNETSINTIPGEDVYFFDSRLLPDYRVKEVIAHANDLAKGAVFSAGGKVKIEAVIAKEAPPKTPVDSPCVVQLNAAIKKSLGVDPKVRGVGGGTCASWFRQAGLPAVVWGTQDEKAHEPNEYCRIENMVRDAKVFFTLCRDAE